MPVSSSISSGRASAGRVDRDLVGARVEHRLGVGDRADATPDRERHEHVVGRTPREVDHRIALVRGGRYVQEHELVGAGGVVTGGQFDRIAGVAQIEEADTLHDASPIDIEARDDALVVHQRRPPPWSAAWPSATVKRPS